MGGKLKPFMCRLRRSDQTPAALDVHYYDGEREGLYMAINPEGSCVAFGEKGNELTVNPPDDELILDSIRIDPARIERAVAMLHPGRRVSHSMPSAPLASSGVGR